MVPYGVPGRVRQVAYAGILTVAAASSAGAAWTFGPWGAGPVCLAAYALAYVLHEHVLWPAWRRWHGVPDFSGTWRNGDDRLVIRQTWTRLSITGTHGGHLVTCCLAGWGTGLAFLQVVLSSPEDPMIAMQISMQGDGLLLSSPTGAFPPRLHHRSR